MHAYIHIMQSIKVTSYELHLSIYRSALAAAILSSSLTGQTWAIPPVWPRSLSESGQSESFISEPNINTANFLTFLRDRWSEDLASRPRLSSPDHSEDELEDKEEEEVESEEDREEHVYQTLDRPENCPITEPVYSLPLKAKVRFYRKISLLCVSKFPNRVLLVLIPIEKNVFSLKAELLNLRQHAQELVDENDALKLTVHRLNVELSCYQTHFRPLSRINGLPKTGSPPPWLLDMKYLSPLLLAYEDRMNEKDALLQTTEEEVKRLRVHVEELIKENERLHDEIAKVGGISQKNCHQLQQQALLVLQENQVLIDQLEGQHVKAKASHTRHYSEGTTTTTWAAVCASPSAPAEVQCNTFCHIVLYNLPLALRQLEQQESRNKSEMDELLLRLSSLQEENRSLALEKANLTADIRRMEAEQELAKQANRKAERRMSVLKRQKEECVLKEEKTRHYMGAVISVAEHISQERDQLIQMASVLQQEKQGFVSRILNGTVQFGKLQEAVKVRFFIQTSLSHYSQLHLCILIKDGESLCPETTMLNGRHVNLILTPDTTVACEATTLAQLVPQWSTLKHSILPKITPQFISY
uniref:Centrosomal protein 89 n=1 Tax=Sander lucioperca TaxID=283035 RepID=A0A8D0A2J5_SANLU